MSKILIRLLGRPAFCVGDQEISSFRSSRIPALVGLMATRPGPWSRDEVASYLWPDRDRESARHNLRQTILYVRQLLGDPAISGDRNSISLNPGIRLDASILLSDRDALQSPLESLNTAERAVDTYGKTFLAGIDDEWIEAVRIKIARRLLAAVLQICEANLNQDPTRSLEMACRAAELEPYLDRARVYKILALRKLGNEAAARAEYRSYKELLRSDLRIEPSQLVRSALEDSLIETNTVKCPPLAFVDQIDALLSSERFAQALELSSASVPIWVRDKAFLQAAEYVRSILARADHVRRLAVYQRAVTSLADLYAHAGNFYEARKLLETQLPNFQDRTARARAHMRLAQIFVSSYRPDLAWSHVEITLSLRDDEQMPEIGIEVTRIAANACYQSNRYEEGARFAETCAELAQKANDFAMFIASTCLRVEGQMSLGLRQAARDTALSALDAVSSQSTPLAAPYRAQLYRLLEEMGEVRMALCGYEEEVANLRELGNPFGLSIGLTYLGDLLSTLDRLPESCQLHQEALSLRHVMGDKLGEATSLRGLGRTYLLMGRLDESSAVLGRSAQIFQECSAIPGYASALLALAEVAARQNDMRLAERLAQQAHRLLMAMAQNELRSIGPGGAQMVSESTALLAQLSVR